MSSQQGRGFAHTLARKINRSGPFFPVGSNEGTNPKYLKMRLYRSGARWSNKFSWSVAPASELSNAAAFGHFWTFESQSSNSEAAFLLHKALIRCIALVIGAFAY